jgi:transposase
LRALLLQAFYSIRSERQLMEQLDFNLLYRWFDAERPLRTVGLGIDDVAGDARVFCKNRDRLPPGNVAQRFLDAVLNDAHVRALLSADHFSVDGTLIEARASMCPQIP